jgi:cysteine-rich repeat protein
MKKIFLLFCSVLFLDGCSVLFRLHCGDKIIDPADSEECDDGNNVDSDGCNNECQAFVCGDGIKKETEACDDGNTTNGDGCDALCAIEVCGDGLENNIDEQCDDGNSINGDECDTNCTISRCGNGITAPNEECDDGDDIDGDGCSECVTEFCGDNIINNINETCDDSNTNNNDGCSSSCIIEFCGDGDINNGNEKCDDGNNINDDGCNEDCITEVCGDGIVNDTIETCDDGNNSNDDGCSSLCIIEVCGDSIDNNINETCDDGNLTNNDGCNDACKLEVCGDGVENFDLILNALDQCDDGNNLGNDGCDASCVVEVCGDNIINNINETCDDGNTNNNDGCSEFCIIEICGDGVENFDLILNALDQCDDGNNLGNDGCSSLCVVEVCGDGLENFDLFLNSFDQCDDGNTSNNDGCSSLCVTEVCGDGFDNNVNETCDDGNTSNDDGCSSLCVIEVCGDGLENFDLFLNSFDQCDDGNNIDNDGCNSLCIIEFCGDGIDNNIDEECDDSTNNINGDGCDVNCTISRCGNEITAPNEECDDGNNFNGDGCSSICGVLCGDGSINALEACDDGNNFNGDGCTTSCELEICGDGSFQAGESCFPGFTPELATEAGEITTNPFGIDTADVNDDGLLDLVVVSTNGSDAALQAGSVDVLLGDGFGGFTAEFHLEGLKQPSFVKAADFNNDGKPDFAVAEKKGNLVSIFRNTSVGAALSFDTPIIVSGIASPTFLATGDINKDGFIDLVVNTTTNNQQLKVITTTNGVAFAVTQTLAGSSGTTGIVVADINQDNNLDIVSTGAPAFNNAGFVQIDFGTGLGSFNVFPLLRARPITGLQFDSTIALHDVNDDDVLDIVLGRFFGGVGLRVFLASSPGLFSSIEDFTLITDSRVFALAQGDFDGDSVEDIATANSFDNSVTIFRQNNITNTLEFQQTIAAGTAPSFLAFGDFNNDSLDDVAVANSSTDNNLDPIDDGNVSIYLSLADGTDNNLASPITNETVIAPTQVFHSKINNDPFEDLLVLSVNGLVSMLAGDGAGSFALPLAVFSNAAQIPVDADIADFDSNGLVDLVTATSATVNLHTQTSPNVFVTTAIQSGASAAVVFAQLDNNPSLEIAALSGTTIQILSDNATAGSFIQVLALTPGGTPKDLLALDVNADGVTDLVTVNAAANTALNFAPVKVNSADLNLDNKPDFVVLSQDGAQLALLLQNETGGFVKDTLITNGDVIAQAVADLNGDGAPELIVTERNTNTVQVYVNKKNASGEFIGPISFATGTNPSSVLLANFTDDLFPDLVLTNQGDETLYLLPFIP